MRKVFVILNLKNHIFVSNLKKIKLMEILIAMFMFLFSSSSTELNSKSINDTKEVNQVSTQSTSVQDEGKGFSSLIR